MSLSPQSAEEALARLIDRGRARAEALGTEHAGLWDGVAAATVGGKRFRPKLVTATHDALAGTVPDVAATVGAAVELLHTAFVIHDDVIDGDDVRRGRLNVSGTFAARARAAGARPGRENDLGLAAGILAGDLALAASLRAVATCGADTGTVHRLLDLFDATLHATAAGELADVQFSLSPQAPSIAQSLDMEAQKTGAYSFALPMQAGAVLAGADETIVSRLGEAGHLVGTAYQLVDDLLGVFGDPDQTGKSCTSDLRSGKRTPLLVHAGATSLEPAISSLVGRDLTSEEQAEARRLLTASGSRRFVEDLAVDHLDRATATLAELGLARDLLPELTACLPVAVESKDSAA